MRSSEEQHLSKLQLNACTTLELLFADYLVIAVEQICQLHNSSASELTGVVGLGF